MLANEAEGVGAIEQEALVTCAFALTNQFFDHRDAPIIVSWNLMGHQVGGGGPFGLGAMRTLTSDYMLRLPEQRPRLPCGVASDRAHHPTVSRRGTAD